MSTMASDTPKRRPRRKFSDEFKEQAAQLVLDEGKSMAAVPASSIWSRPRSGNRIAAQLESMELFRHEGFSSTPWECVSSAWRGGTRASTGPAIQVVVPPRP